VPPVEHSVSWHDAIRMKGQFVISGVRRKFSWGEVLVQGHMVVICIWCALFVMSQFDVIFPCFQTNVLAKFVDIVYIFFYIHSPYFMCRCTEYEVSAV